jgi:GNAT superfamily N-acetyltransferase
VLYDTAESVNGATREASRVAFIPIGHISLDSKNKDAERFGLEISSEGVFWIKSFFILQSLQGEGIGRASMDEVEEMAAREPLRAQTLMLDTVTKEHQIREDFAVSTYGAVPKVSTYTLKYLPNLYQTIYSFADH